MISGIQKLSMISVICTEAVSDILNTVFNDACFKVSVGPKYKQKLYYL